MTGTDLAATVAAHGWWHVTAVVPAVVAVACTVRRRAHRLTVVTGTLMVVSMASMVAIPGGPVALAWASALLAAGVVEAAAARRRAGTAGAGGEEATHRLHVGCLQVMGALGVAAALASGAPSDDGGGHAGHGVGGSLGMLAVAAGAALVVVAAWTATRPAMRGVRRVEALAGAAAVGLMTLGLTA